MANLKRQREKEFVKEIEEGDLNEIDPVFGSSVVDILSLNCDIITDKFFTSSRHSCIPPKSSVLLQVYFPVVCFVLSVRKRRTRRRSR
jgi:hypothetical protein